jgi:hypothetical protein
VQFPSHAHRQRPLSIQHLVDAIGPADIAHPVLDGEIALLHHKLDRLDRVRWIETKTLCLIGFQEV